MTNNSKSNQLQDKVDDLLGKIFYWSQENLDIVTAMSVASLSIVLFALTITKLGPHIHSCREKVKEVLFEPAERPINLSQALRYITSGNIEKLTHSVGRDGCNQLHMRSIDGDKFKTYVMPGSESSVFNLISMHIPDFHAIPSRNLFSNIFVPIMIPLLSVLSLQSAMQSDLDDSISSCRPYTFLSRFTPNWISSFFSNNNQTEKKISRPESPLTFEDVISPVKDELYEIVELLNDPQKFSAVGASCPRGVLITGPSGVGKTMIARAVAEEANTNFISCTASSFVEMYIGRGAKRVRQIFEKARQQAPAVLFIDELDALQSRRDMDTEHGSLWASNDEYVQTLNQVLHEMDGFDGRDDNILIIGATNRPRAIDPALLRSGRFDRCIHMQLPSHADRFEILKVSIRRRGLRLSQLALQRLPLIAQRTNGWSGAELDSLINEAAFSTYRRRQLTSRSRGDIAVTTQEDLEDALERSSAFRMNKLGLMSSNEQIYSGS